MQTGTIIGFTGFAFAATDRPREMLERMAGRFVPGPETVVHHVLQPGFGLSVLAKGEAAAGLAEDPARRLVLAVQGQFAPSCLPGDTVRRGPAAVAAALLQLWAIGGAEQLAGLNGRFACVVWDGSARELHLLNDRLGMRRCCWLRIGETLLFGTGYRPFLAWPGVSTRPDDTGVAEFMAYGHPLQERTLLQDVHLLMPGTHLRCSAAGVASHHRELPLPEARRDGDLDSHADELGETLREVIADYAGALDSPVTLPLTGGLDARTILGFARLAEAPVRSACTFGHAHCHDVRLARRLARAAGVPHRYIHLHDSYVREHGMSGLLATEGERPARNLYYMVIAKTLGGGGQLWSGFLGDSLLGRPRVEYHPDPDIDETQHLARMARVAYYNNWGGRTWNGDDLIPQVVRAPWRDLFDTAPRETLQALLQAQPGDSLMQRATVTDLCQRQRRYTVSQLELLGGDFEVVAPFYDHRVQDLALALPPAMLQGQRLYRRMITRYLPALAAIPDTHTLRPVACIGISGAPPAVSASHAGGLWLMLPAGVRWRVDGLLSSTGIRRAWGRGLALASGGWLGAHDRGMYAHYDQVLRHDPALFRGVLESPALLEPYFDPAGVKRLLDAHLCGRTNAAIALFNLWTYARWRQYLGAGDVPGN